ncbi:phosphate uptake regulator PhoU [Draconibacterium sp. IB214405]|uniref:phosphate signaling complex PhoU family protein n=1 Tax=Draconibacterium sp. IB214405 TaxID=3097352 RepID=UPI002A116405|nr:phosphate uptake regulator PhoU [Draconibacterium sp. IB214405]MDX8338161.1 phosphate uptake regulator PhoU [Draconibacterium sp. IB214405]
MTLKKDDAIKAIMSDFEEFANLVLHQLDLLETLISTGETKFPKEQSKELYDNENMLDKMEVKISDKIINTITLYQPVASDIRKIMACYRIIMSLERVGDMVINVLSFVESIKTPEVYTKLSEVISNMLIQSSSMVNKSLLAFTNDDKDYAIWTIKNDAVVDELNKKMLKKAIKKSTSSNEDKELLISFINMNSMVTTIERIADQATNIAEAAIYSIEGKDIRHKDLK